MRNEKIAILKFIDHWVGGPICILFALFYRSVHPFYKTYLNIPLNHLPPRKILIIKFFGLGSIALASSMVFNIRNTYKATKIYFLTFRDNQSIVDIFSLADKVLTIDTRNPLLLVKTIFQAIFFCWKERIDIVIDIEFYSKFSTIMSFLSGARWRMGFYLARFWRNSLVNVPIYFNYSRHILEIYNMFTQALRAENHDLYPKTISFNDQEKKDFLNILRSFGVSNVKDILGLNIHASDLALCRRWPVSKFVSFIELFLLRYPHIDVVLTGVKNEIAYSQKFLKLLSEGSRKRVIDLTGKLSLRHFLILLSDLPLFITNDTGPFHLAKSVGASTISLWGPGSVDLYGPFLKEKNTHTVIYKRYSCSPCLYIYRTDAGYFCEDKAPCMESINPEDIMALIPKYLKS